MHLCNVKTMFAQTTENETEHEGEVDQNRNQYARLPAKTRYIDKIK